MLSYLFLWSNKNTKMIIPNYNTGTIYVHLSPEDLGKCKDLANTFSKLGEWGGLNTYGGGVGNTPKDTKKVERVGALGELAFNKLTGLSVNEQYKANGDDGFDFTIPSFSIDVKCQMSFYEQAIDWGFYGEFFTKAHHVNGEYVPPRADMLVLACLSSADCWDNKFGNDWDRIRINNKESTNIIVEFFGAISSQIVFDNYQERLGAPFQKNGPNVKKGDFKNYYINRNELIPMIDFLYEYKNELVSIGSDIFI